MGPGHRRPRRPSQSPRPQSPSDCPAPAESGPSYSAETDGLEGLRSRLGRRHPEQSARRFRSRPSACDLRHSEHSRRSEARGDCPRAASADAAPAKACCSDHKRAASPDCRALPVRDRRPRGGFPSGIVPSSDKYAAPSKPRVRPPRADTRRDRDSVSSAATSRENGYGPAGDISRTSGAGTSRDSCGD